jgi:hypothetical protein
LITGAQQPGLYFLRLGLSKRIELKTDQDYQAGGYYDQESDESGSYENSDWQFDVSERSI